MQPRLHLCQVDLHPLIIDHALAIRPGRFPGQLVADGMVETLYRSLLILTFGGGTNEIQRDLIGLFGLGLPRIPRM